MLLKTLRSIREIKDADLRCPYCGTYFEIQNSHEDVSIINRSHDTPCPECAEFFRILCSTVYTTAKIEDEEAVIIVR